MNHLQRFGQAAVPVWRVDRFLAEPDDWVAEAGTRVFDRDVSAHYPGVRAFLPTAMADEWLGQLPALLAPFQLTGNPVCKSLCFSLTTTPPHALRPSQWVPHVDSPANNLLALVVYLFHQDLGGTGFFRHRHTGLECVMQDSTNAYASALRRELPQHTALHRHYPRGDNALFVQTGKVAASFNRAVLYPANCLHSGLLTGPESLSSRPERGRLTLNALIEIEDVV